MTNAKKYDIICKVICFTGITIQRMREMNVMLVRLFDVYAPLLTDRQRDIMSLYYNEDESLSEIAENTGITRQGVRDCIKKTEAQLVEYENALKLASREARLSASLDALRRALDSADLEAARAAADGIRL